MNKLLIDCVLYILEPGVWNETSQQTSVWRTSWDSTSPYQVLQSVSSLYFFLSKKIMYNRWCQQSYIKAASERTHCQRKIYSFFFMWHYFYFFLYCSYLQVLILIVSLDLESLRKLIQEDRLVKVKRFIT